MTRSNHKATPSEAMISDCIGAVLVHTKATPSGAIQCSITDAREAVRVVIEAARPSVTSIADEALKLFVETAVIDEHTHRVTVDEWVLSKARAALSESNRSIFIEPR